MAMIEERESGFIKTDELEKQILNLLIDCDLERLDGLLGTANIFELVGLQNSEIRHSIFLKNLLDPLSPLGISDSFLRHLLRQVLTGATQCTPTEISPLEIELVEFNNCNVYREYKNIDLLIEITTLKNRYCICIENKIDANESKHQLTKYRLIAEEDFPAHKKLYLFLTPNGDSAKNDAAWIPIDYSSVTNSINHVLSSLGLSPEQVLLLSHYKKLLERNVIGDKELQDLANQIYKRHKNALDFIFEYREDTNLAESNVTVERIGTRVA